MADILLKLILVDLESGDILNKGIGRRYNILGNTDCPTPEEGGHFETSRTIKPPSAQPLSTAA